MDRHSGAEVVGDLNDGPLLQDLGADTRSLIWLRLRLRTRFELQLRTSAMTIEIKITDSKKVAVAFLQVEAGVRYWDDGEVNGVQDSEDGTLMPCKDGDSWCPVIDLATGTIEGWPEGTTADIHYAGRYTLLDAERKTVKTIDGYVPAIMSPGGEGYGDYIIMTIDGAGKIEKWRADFDAFTGAV